jgi:hypothetical protein
MQTPNRNCFEAYLCQASNTGLPPLNLSHSVAFRKKAAGTQAAFNAVNSAHWAKRAVPFFIQLGRKDNGRPLMVPGGRE